MSNYKFETLQLHVGQEQPDPATDSRAVPIYQTTSYVFRNSQHAADRFGLADSGNIYGRLTNSTQGVFEQRIAALEGGSAALAVASGAAAITYTIQALAANGGHIVAQKTIYGGSYNLLAHTLTQYGITTTFVDAHNLDEIKAAIQDDTRAIYLETLGNPNSDIPDIDAIVALAHEAGLPVVVDNTFGTPYLFRPFEHGADIVVHSATKFIGGHGTTLGGIIIESGKFDWKASGKYGNIADPNPSYHGISFYDAVGPAAFVTFIRAILLRDTGATISPFNAFLLLQGTETLSLRLDRHAENTKKVVEFLKNHPKVAKVNHPSLPDHPDHALYEKYFLMVVLVSSHSMLRVAKKKLGNSLIILRYSHFLLTLLMLRALLFIQLQQLILSLQMRNLLIRVLTRAQSDFLLVQSISMILLLTLRRDLQVYN